MTQDRIHPYQILRDLESRHSLGAHGLPQQQEARQVWRGIGFTVLGASRLAPLDQVDEILTPPTLTRVPLTRPWMLGVANVRGNLLPVVDLRAFLTGEASVPTKASRVLAVRCGELFFGLLVEAVSGLQSLDQRERAPGDGGRSDAMSRYTRDHFRLEATTLPVVDLHALALDERFLQVAA